MSWELRDSGVRTEVAGVTVEITPQRGIAIAACDLPGVDFQIREWTQYNIVASVPIVRVRGVDWVPLSGSSHIATFRLQNRVGRLTVVVELEGGFTDPFRAEVLSHKFPTPESHVQFLDGLLRDLVARVQDVELVPAASTAFGVEDDPRGPTPLSDLHTLLRWREPVVQAVEAILADPHRTLQEAEHHVRLSDVATVSSDLVYQLASPRGDLTRIPDHWPLAERTGGIAPEAVDLFTSEDSFDTPENRLVSQILLTVSDTVRRLEETTWLWKALDDEQQQQLTDLGAHVQFARLTSFLGELSPGSMPFGSQVLVRRHGYRELWSFWQELALGRQGVLGAADESIANRDIALLYEVWGLFALADELREVLGPVERWVRLTDERFGVRHRAEARFADGWSLIYNRGFHRPTSYSLGLRPDYTLMRRNEPFLAFDAKFRFELPPANAESEDELEAELKIPQGDATPRAADIVKMHAYRDALGLRSAVIVYPGTEARFHELAPDRGAKRATVPLSDLVSGGVEGVGALPLRP